MGKVRYNLRIVILIESEYRNRNVRLIFSSDFAFRVTFLRNHDQRRVATAANTKPAPTPPNAIPTTGPRLEGVRVGCTLVDVVEETEKERVGANEEVSDGDGVYKKKSKYMGVS